MIALLLALACGRVDALSDDRFSGDRALRRTLATIDRDRDGTVETRELPDGRPDQDRNGALSVEELRRSLDIDPWSVRARDLQAKVVVGPDERPSSALSRDVDHAPQMLVRDVLRFLRRELDGDGRTVPTEALILQAAGTGRLDSVPAKEAMAILREAAVAHGTPLPDPPPVKPPPCCANKAPATIPGP